MLRGASVVAALTAVPAQAASLDEMLETAGGWADGAVRSARALNPTTLQIGLIGGSVLVAALGLWLLLRRPRQTDEEREAAAILAQRLPDLRVRTQTPRPAITRGPRLLEAVAAMKAENAMQAAEHMFRRDRD